MTYQIIKVGNMYFHSYRQSGITEKYTFSYENPLLFCEDIDVVEKTVEKLKEHYPNNDVRILRFTLEE